ncbi:MAG: glycosyltransferase family 2 protein [Candidatus Dormibacteraceae bacterium]
MTTARRTKLSAIVACYRDAPAIPHMYSRLKAVFDRLDVDGEIIVVNDASPDDAAAVLRDLAARDHSVTVVNHSRNFGSQAAFTSGMRISTGDAVILMDGDLQDPPELIEKFVERWRQGYLVVYGERVTRDAPPHMRFFYKAFYRVFRATSYVKVPVDAGDFSLLDRQVVDAINELPENNRFIRGLRAWVGFKQVGVQYVRPERMFGVTTNSFLRNIQWARQGILSFSYVPLEFITWIGLVTVALAFVAIVFQVVSRLVDPKIVASGFTTVIVLILFIGGIQLLSLSIIGSYLAHIYDEVKHRPPYVVESILNQPKPRSDD